MLYEMAIKRMMFLRRQVNMKMCLLALSTHEQEWQTEMILLVTSYPQTSLTHLFTWLRSIAWGFEMSNSLLLFSLSH